MSNVVDTEGLEDVSQNLFEMKNIYGKMNKEHQTLMEDNQTPIENMLDYAIMELGEIAKNNDIFLVDNLNLCNI